jgi:hypothetical protein
MKYNNFQETINTINNIVQKQLWMDFEFNQFNGYELIIGGTIDLSDNNYLITIKFSDINFLCLNASWKSDTTKEVLRVLSPDEVQSLKENATIENEYIIFQFIAEDLVTKLYIAAKSISFEYDSTSLSAPKLS